MLSEAPFAILVTGLVLVGLYVANRLYDYGVPHWFSRKIGHFAGGGGYLIFPFVFSQPWWPIILSTSFTVLLLVARMLRPRTFRGVGGSARLHAMAEINFPIAGTVSLIVLWAWLDEPLFAILPPCFLGFGDAVTGVLRSAMYDRETKGNVGSVAMLATCLVLAYLASPYWIGAAGAAVATVAEKVTPARTWVDDNLTLTLASVVVIALCLGVT